MNHNRQPAGCLRGVRYVLFDAVGTVIHVRPSVAEVYLAVGSRHGSRLSINQIRSRFAAEVAAWTAGSATTEDLERQRWQSLVARVLSDVPQATGRPFQELWDAFASPAQWSLFEDVPQTWSRLQQRGFQLAIASNFDSRLPPLCRALPPLDSARHCFVSSDVQFTKPHPEFFRRIEATLQARPEELLMVGDHPEHDFDGARSVGWHALHLDRKSPRPNGESISSLSELLKMLDAE